MRICLLKMSPVLRNITFVIILGTLVCGEYSDLYESVKILEDKLIDFNKSINGDQKYVNTEERSSNPCIPDPCQNEGTCYVETDSYKCYCPDGYAGVNCEYEDMCYIKNFCLNGGTCIPTRTDGSRCLCPPSFTGYRCQNGDNQMSTMPEYIKETASVLVTTGSTIQTSNEDTSEASTIHSTIISWPSTSPSTGTTEKTCQCGKHSYGCRWNDQGFKNCSCFPGYAQIKGICLDCYCGRKGIDCHFDENENKVCTCQSGYAQRNQTCSVMCKSDGDCFNGGICKYEGHGYFCNCRKNFAGDSCEINRVCEAMNRTCNAIGAVCVYMEWLEKGVCECPPRKVFSRKSQICEDICHPNSCVHGKCEVVDYHFECRCDIGYKGTLCDEIISKESNNFTLIVLCGLLFVSIVCILILALTAIVRGQKVKNNFTKSSGKEEENM